MIDSTWYRVTYRLPPENEGPEVERVAMLQYLEDRPSGLRVAGVELKQADKYGHWVDIHLDTED